MNKTLTTVFTAATFCASFASAGTLTETFTSYYAFGDSLTDDGKIDDANLQNISDDGRFSTGPVYAEYIAEEFEGAGQDTGNLALGGATASTPTPPASNPLSFFAGQIGVFANALLNSTPLPPATRAVDPQPALNIPEPGSNPLVSVFFGANDLFGLQSYDETTIQGFADAVATGIRTLGSLAGGGVFTSFFVLDLPDTGATPAAASGVFNLTASELTDATNVFNAQLALNMGLLRDEGFDIIEFDTSAAIDALILEATSDPSSTPITELFVPCTASLGDASGLDCTLLGGDPEAFAFADGVHPNGFVQSRLGDAAISQLNAATAPVPLPAGGALLIGAVSVFVLGRRHSMRKTS